jgi:hypothetical protein
MPCLWSEEQSVHVQSNSCCNRTWSVRVEFGMLDSRVTHACARNKRPRPVTDCDIQVMLSASSV